MTDILKYLFKSFVLLRDLFGYLIPGIILAALIEPAESWNFLASNPNRDLLVVLLLGCYAAGQILYAFGILVTDCCYHAYNKFFKCKWSGNQYDHDKPHHVNKLYYPSLYPDIFIEPQRHDNVQIMRVGVSIALIIAGVMHMCSKSEADTKFLHDTWIACLVVGIIQLLKSRFGKVGDEYRNMLFEAGFKAAEMRITIDRALKK